MDWSKKLALAGLACIASAVALADDAAKATAEFKGCGEVKVTGTATLTEQVTPEGVKEVTVAMKVQGLADGKHAVHIHEVGQCEPCAAAGGHHDPGPSGQSRPDTAADTVPATDINHPFHMGDLINLEVKGGVGTLEHTTSRVTLSPGRLSLFDADGSSIIVHTQADTYCDQESELKKGCAGGAREACAVLKPAR
ncbi:MAG TPA: superoxide dismutase family protein [Steroidobacteraceae bacterium]|nr:superoxide dismutase family protein [Steroidobacteraceae bacterium]